MTHTFRVWAPSAPRVAVDIGGRRSDMLAREGGWWEATAEGAGPGTRYAFTLDDGPPRPDPRSPSQPEGVHRPSEIVDHSSFSWRDSGWRGLPLPGSVLYEVHVGTFTGPGTFDALIERLPYLVDLGIDGVELLPVAEFPGDYGWGYDGVDLFAPHHCYGGPEGLKRLVDACHAHGLGVVMDVVYNHLGPSGNYLAEFGPYFTHRHHTDWGAAVNFDEAESDEVRRFVIDNALMWLRDYHCDGLRIDAVHAIADKSPIHILEQLSAEVDALACHLHRPLFLIGESDLNEPRLVQRRDHGGYGLDAAWADDWHHAVHALLTGEQNGYYSDFGSLSTVAKALRQAWVYDGQWSRYRRRTRGRRPTGLDGNRFVVSSQNHDQVGNRAKGERLGHLTSTARIKVAAALLLTGPFMPMLFQGEEWAATSPFQYFADMDDENLRRAVRDGRRREFAAFGWNPEDIPDPGDRRTLERSKLDWSELPNALHADVLDWYRQLIGLRHALPALSDPRLEENRVFWDEGAGWVVAQRGQYLVAASLAPDTVVLPVPVSCRTVAVSNPSIYLGDGRLVLPPDSVAIVRTAQMEVSRDATVMASRRSSAAAAGQTDDEVHGGGQDYGSEQV